jgi:predicted metal-dependent enzyme (double-stranded beta helix superfamily)
MENLITQLSENFTTNLESLLPFFVNYTANDWVQYIKENGTHYKNLVFSNTEFELYVITWNMQEKTKIHNHADFGCLMKVLTGKLDEILYDIDLTMKEKNTYKTNDVSFISNEKGYHSIFNNNNQIAVTLHLYSPINHETRFLS